MSPFTLKKQPDRSKSPCLFEIFHIAIEDGSVPDITFSFDATMKYLHVITEPPLLQGFSTFTFKQQPAHFLSRSSQIDTMYYRACEYSIRKLPAYDFTLKYSQAATNSYLFQGFSPSTLKQWMT